MAYRKTWTYEGVFGNLLASENSSLPAFGSDSSASKARNIQRSSGDLAKPITASSIG
jgi:hypothetical protein